MPFPTVVSNTILLSIVPTVAIDPFICLVNILLSSYCYFESNFDLHFDTYRRQKLLLYPMVLLLLASIPGGNINLHGNHFRFYLNLGKFNYSGLLKVTNT